MVRHIRRLLVGDTGTALRDVWLCCVATRVARVKGTFLRIAWLFRACEIQLCCEKSGLRVVGLIAPSRVHLRRGWRLVAHTSKILGACRAPIRES